MPRCVVCDFSDETGSLSTVTERSGGFQWSNYYNGYLCKFCSFDHGPHDGEIEEDELWDEDMNDV